MGNERIGRVWSAINVAALAEKSRPAIQHACTACAQALGAVGTGFSIRSSGGQLEPVFASDPSSERLDDLQLTLGQGPLLDALTRSGPVLVPDLADHSVLSRWPVFAPEAADQGIGAMFAFPVAAGAARIGVLNVYRLSPGSLPADLLADALAYADALLVLVLDSRTEWGVNGDEPDIADMIERRLEVHQAAGMTSVQLGTDVTDALVRLRAYAYLHNRPLAEVAADVVARRLRFAPGDEGDTDNIATNEENDGRGRSEWP